MNYFTSLCSYTNKLISPERLQTRAKYVWNIANKKDFTSANSLRAMQRYRIKKAKKLSLQTYKDECRKARDTIYIDSDSSDSDNSAQYIPPTRGVLQKKRPERVKFTRDKTDKNYKKFYADSTTDPTTDSTDSDSSNPEAKVSDFTDHSLEAEYFKSQLVEQYGTDFSVLDIPPTRGKRVEFTRDKGDKNYKKFYAASTDSDSSSPEENVSYFTDNSVEAEDVKPKLVEYDSTDSDSSHNEAKVSDFTDHSLEAEYFKSQLVEQYGTDFSVLDIPPTRGKRVEFTRDKGDKNYKKFYAASTDSDSSSPEENVSYFTDNSVEAEDVKPKLVEYDSDVSQYSKNTICSHSLLMSDGDESETAAFDWLQFCYEYSHRTCVQMDIMELVQEFYSEEALDLTVPKLPSYSDQASFAIDYATESTETEKCETVLDSAAEAEEPLDLTVPKRPSYSDQTSFEPDYATESTKTDKCETVIDSAAEDSSTEQDGHVADSSGTEAVEAEILTATNQFVTVCGNVRTLSFETLATMFTSSVCNTYCTQKED